MPRILLSPIVLCLVLMFSLFSPVSPMAADFSGQWLGAWASYDTEDSYLGGISANFLQTGGTLTGTLAMTGTDCGNFTDLPLSNGVVADNNVSADVAGYCADPYVAADITVHFVGTLIGGVIYGTYNAYLTSTMETVDSGTFSMTRSSLGVMADFTANVTSGAAPLAVNFTNMSQGQCTSFYWNFGDGGTSNQENPSHTYNSPGTYTVSLTVSGSEGTDTETKTNYITVGQPAQKPAADFVGSPTTDMPPMTVDFTDLSTGPITSWSWTFEEGEPGTSTQQNPSNILFLLPGTYTVTLTVTGPGGSDTETKTGYITADDPRPVADFSAEPTSGLAPLSVQFTDSSTGNVTSRSWSFGDGGTSNLQNPSYVYNTPGTYTVSLTVSGPVPSIPPSNGTKTRTDYITVAYPPPVAKFTASLYQGEAPLQVQFTDQSTGHITSRTWDFGDGTPGSSDPSPNHTYNATGLYPVTLQVTGDGGSSSSAGSVFVYEIMYVNKQDATCGGNSPCRTTLQNAVNDCSQYALIKATQDTYGENLQFSPAQTKVIMLQGGYDAGFANNAGFTTANQLTVGGSGTLIAEKLQFQGGGIAGASAGSADSGMSVLAGSEGGKLSTGAGDKIASAFASAGSGAYWNEKSIAGAATTGGLSGQEAQDAFHAAVARIYRAAVGRDPHPDEVLRTADYALGISLEYEIDLGYALWDVASSIFSSEESCVAKECVSGKTISTIYMAVLGREPSSDEKAYWLASPAGVNSLLYALIGSEEFVKESADFKELAPADHDRSVLCAAFIALLDRLPAPEELDYWRSYPINYFIEALLASKEYRNKALSEEETALRIILLEEDAYLHTKR